VSVVAADQHVIQWVTASPLWARSLDDAEAMRRPALLRFSSDAFMDELAALLAAEPARLDSAVAVPESFRARPVGAAPGWRPPVGDLKLYQPAHGRYYLVAAMLVCRLAGLPDHQVEPADGEVAAFVLRRLGPDGEMAWEADPATPGRRRWRSLPAGERLAVADGEELLPLLPVNFRDGARDRRLLVGFVPTTSGESFAPTGGLQPFALDPGPGGTVRDPRHDELLTRVIEPLRALKARPTAPSALTGTDLARALEAAAEQRRAASRFLLLDLADFLNRRSPAAWASIRDEVEPAAGPGRDLYRELAAAVDDLAPAMSWRAAMRQVWGERDRIAGAATAAPTLRRDLGATPLDPARLADRVLAVLPPLPDSEEARLALLTPDGTRPADAVPMPKLDPRARYVLRCLYRRPRCRPPRPDLISEPTEAFGLASFFDPDAPARPVRIPLPEDTSQKGLRAHHRNVGFLISSQLRTQMNQVTSLKAAMDGNVTSGESFGLGTICMLSIPIITICALIILMIFINLLNFVFWWLPFFRICLPTGGGDRGGG
jgi:hypothetical protein